MKLVNQLSMNTAHISLVNNGLKSFKEFYVANEDDYQDIHHLLENESMELSDYVRLKYTRRPDLFGSYLESGQIPAIITDKEKKFLGVVSETSIMQYGESRKVYYTSDLRISKSAGLRTRANFRKAYLEVLAELPHDCYTVVLKDNERAIKALTRGQSDLYYHKVYEYVSRAIVVLPTFRLIKVRSDKFDIYEENNHSYVKEKIEKSAFANIVNEEDTVFCIRKVGKVVGQFSISRPDKRSLFVESKSTKVSFWLKALRMIFGHEYERKIPWCYITSLYLDEDLNKSEVIEYICRYLYLKNYISSGELLLLCHGAKESINPHLYAPEFLTRGNLYKVSSCNYATEFGGEVYLNPIAL